MQRRTQKKRTVDCRLLTDCRTQQAENKKKNNNIKMLTRQRSNLNWPDSKLYTITDSCSKTVNSLKSDERQA